MNSAKCRKCGLANFATERECKRCGNLLFSEARSPGSGPRFSLGAVLIFAGIAALGYFFLGAQGSAVKVGTADANRVAAAQPSRQPEAALSRTEYDSQRSQYVANAVGVSPGLIEHNNRTQQTEKALDQLTNSQQR